MDFIIAMLVGVGLTVLSAVLIQRKLSFSAQRPEDYAGLGPDIDIRQHLSGPIQCEGVIYGPTGRVSSRFVAEFDGDWSGNRGHLAEKFTYDGATHQNREWHLQLHEGGSITATAPDVVGTGYGWQVGSAVLLKYRIRLPESSGGHVLSVTDWMYLTENGTIMNRSQFRKFGIKVAELVATMRPMAAEMSDAGAPQVTQDVA